MKKALLLFAYLIPIALFATESGQGNWEARLNDFFGIYIVSPLAALLFWPIPYIQMPLVVAWLLGGALYFTLRMRFVNILLFKHALQLVFGKQDNSKKSGEVSHFQALTTALSATVGLPELLLLLVLGGPEPPFG
jgi:AGCS family alanine or glycine:cation symporter